ncbi:HWE histidine kinase domain-containing protein [Sphingomonas beigongshangi]|uniref:HWE histidine kinase domain-containing protein n=1 Tax=Sphingomonas beigongshangi TaxID=2782540 RepID=UPI001AEEE672|nr:HWE histidine kinase domain-containing protein [Sphingomonas beigongshangi]
MMSNDSPLSLADVTISELRHRLKNLISIAQALVIQSLRGSEIFTEAAATIEKRLDAVASSVDLMLRTDWGPVDLRELAPLALAQSASFTDRISIEGPKVDIAPDWVTMLIVALHELETNALKYGALSNNHGSVRLSWAVSGRSNAQPVLDIEWCEIGGPPVAKPEHTGFGSRLATTLLQRHLRGRAELIFEERGLIWRVSAPLADPSTFM